MENILILKVEYKDTCNDRSVWCLVDYVENGQIKQDLFYTEGIVARRAFDDKREYGSLNALMILAKKQGAVIVKDQEHIESVETRKKNNPYWMPLLLILIMFIFFVIFNKF